MKVALALTAAVAAVALTGCGEVHFGKQQQAAAPSKAALPDYVGFLHSCDIFDEPWATVGDSGHTLTMGGSTNPDRTAHQMCVLHEMHITDAVVSQMNATSALMGRQQATWPGYSISWTYSGANGLDAVVQTQQ